MSQFSEQFMGGAPGDGFTTSLPTNQSSLPVPTSTPTVSTTEANMTESMGSNGATEPTRISPGSVTQYASQIPPPAPAPQPAAPPPTAPQSYAERSAQAHAATGAPVPSSSASVPVAQQSAPPPAASTSSVSASATAGHGKAGESPAMQAHQNRILTDSTRKVQEHAYYMRQAMDRDDLPVVLDRASRMLGELGEHNHHHHHHPHSPGTPRHDSGSGASQLTPKNYYELYMRVLDDVPNLEEYLLNLSQGPEHVPPNQVVAPRFTMKEIYQSSQFCPRALQRLYLQICAGSALIRSKEVGTKWVMNDLIESVKCVQCPLRGLFLRHYLLQALRDKLPDNPPQIQSQAEGAEAEATLPETTKASEEQKHGDMDPGNVKDSYEFVLANFIEMNKLWVRIQHLPGDGKSKELRKRRERERNELRILVGTNLVRISQLEGVTSQIYGEVILPKILEQIVACRDPLAQAYLIDCIIQVFPDEYHIETLSILLGVCPKLREKVNIRTILQSLMDRLANYYADEELLDETDTNEVKKAMAQDSFIMFEECVQNVYNARGPHLTSKEVIRLQIALLNFSLKCYPGHMEQVNKCLKVCVDSLNRVGGGGEYSAQPEDTGVSSQMADTTNIAKNLDEASVKELEKLLSIPLDSLALKILELDYYSDLLTFLPWNSRRDVAMTLLKAIDTSGGTPRDAKQIDQLFSIIAPVIRDENAPVPAPTGQSGVDRTSDLLAGLGVDTSTTISFGASFSENDPGRQRELQQECVLVSKLVHLMDSEDTDVAHEMLSVARKHLSTGGRQRIGQTLVPVVFSALRLARRVYALEFAAIAAPVEKAEVEDESAVSVGEAKEGTEAPEEAAAEGESTNESSNVTTEAPPEGEPAGEENDAGKSTGNHAADEEGKEAISYAPESEVAQPVVAPPPAPDDKLVIFSKSVNCRKLFVFLQQSVSMLAKGNAEVALKLYLQVAVAADAFAGIDDRKEIQHPEFAAITYELIAQAFILHEDEISDSKAQQRCMVSMIGSLLACQSLGKDDYEGLITKAAQYAAKMLKKPDQCRMVALCAHLFYKGEEGESAAYHNPQRVLECLQRALKLADACTMTSASNVGLFVDLLDHYVYFFEKRIPLIQDRYVSGLIALINEHLNSFGSVSDAAATADAKAHFKSILLYLAAKKEDAATKEQFASIDCDVTVAT